MTWSLFVIHTYVLGYLNILFSIYNIKPKKKKLYTTGNARMWPAADPPSTSDLHTLLRRTSGSPISYGRPSLKGGVCSNTDAFASDAEVRWLSYTSSAVQHRAASRWRHHRLHTCKEKLLPGCSQRSSLTLRRVRSPPPPSIANVRSTP